MSAIFVLFIPLVLYMLVIRPQRQRVHSQRSLLATLTPGDEVVTAGGMIGTLLAMGPERATVQFAPDVIIDFLPPAIVRKLTVDPPGEPDGTGEPDHLEES